MLILQRPWTEQPQGGVGGPSRADIVRAENLAFPFATHSTVGSVAVQPSSAGIGPRFSASSANYLTSSILRMSELTGPITICVAFTRTGSGANSTDNLLLAADHDSSWVAMPFSVAVYNTGELQIGRSGGSSGNRSWIKTTETPSSVGVPLCAVFRSNTSSAGSGLSSLTSFFANGRKLTSTIAFEAGTSSAITSTSHSIFVGRQSTSIGTSYAVNAIVHGYFIFNRALSDNECAEISANPWQLFAPRTQRIWPPAATSGLPTLSAATYVPGSLTASGFRPRVTATY